MANKQIRHLPATGHPKATLLPPSRSPPQVLVLVGVSTRVCFDAPRPSPWRITRKLPETKEKLKVARAKVRMTKQICPTPESFDTADPRRQAPSGCRDPRGTHTAGTASSRAPLPSSGLLPRGAAPRPLPPDRAGCGCEGSPLLGAAGTACRGSQQAAAR